PMWPLWVASRRSRHASPIGALAAGRRYSGSLSSVGLGSRAGAAARGLELPRDRLALVVYPQPPLEQRDRLPGPSGQPERAPEVEKRVGVGQAAALGRR